MPNDKMRDELLSELEEEGSVFFHGGAFNNVMDLCLTGAVVLASLAATVLATTDPHVVPRWVLAAVAAIPAAAASLQRIVSIRERSNWYFLYAAHVRSLAKKLRFGQTSVEEIAKKRADLEVEMEVAWGRIGHSGTAPGTADRGRVRS